MNFCVGKDNKGRQRIYTTCSYSSEPVCATDQALKHCHEARLLYQSKIYLLFKGRGWGRGQAFVPLKGAKYTCSLRGGAGDEARLRTPEWSKIHLQFKGRGWGRGQAFVPLRGAKYTCSLRGGAGDEARLSYP